MVELPTTFGKYYLTEHLATGGMAEIYLAKLIGPKGFEKPLVIKKIHPRLSAQPQFVELFVAEAKTLVALTHANIVPVFELGTVGDDYFLAMEYIDGPTLYRLTEQMFAKDVCMPAPVAAWITSQLLAGLAYAHRRGGVIHRDLSPRNVMLSRDGDVKLVDFGIAIATDDGPHDGESAPTGSFPYMSPEQANRTALTPRSDLFSVGVLAWEMLAGQRLFYRATAEETLAAVRAGVAPPPSHHNPACPPELDRLVARALAVDPEDRWPDADAFLQALQRYLFALPNVPAAADVATFIDRYTPRGRARRPTDVEADRSLAGSGPTTAVLPRPGVNARSFATHVQLAQALAAAPDAKPSPPQAVSPPSPGAPGRRMLLGVLGLVVIAGTTWAVARQVRSPAAEPPAPTANDAGARAFNASIADAAVRPDSPPDASQTAVALDAQRAPTHDAPPTPLRDASVRAPRDAAVRPPRAVDAQAGSGAAAGPDAAATVAATGTVRVGAKPWGNVIVDGVPRGRTPLRLTLPAGRHAIEVEYPAVTPAKRQRFNVDIPAGGEAPAQLIDFAAGQPPAAPSPTP